MPSYLLPYSYAISLFWVELLSSTREEITEAFWPLYIQGDKLTFHALEVNLPHAAPFLTVMTWHFSSAFASDGCLGTLQNMYASLKKILLFHNNYLCAHETFFFSSINDKDSVFAAWAFRCSLQTKKLEVVCYRLIVIYLLIADKAFSTDLDTNLRQSLFWRSCYLKPSYTKAGTYS